MPRGHLKNAEGTSQKTARGSSSHPSISPSKRKEASTSASRPLKKLLNTLSIEDAMVHAAPFRDAVRNTYAHPTMRAGENGCPEYSDRGLQSNILALSQLVRGGDPSALCQQILARAETRDVSDLMILMFVTRNTRGGKGEKKLAYDMFLRVWKAYPETAKRLLKLFPFYGYWKDLLLLAEQAVGLEDKDMAENILSESLVLMREQLAKDAASLSLYKLELAVARDEGDEGQVKSLEQKGPSISLLAKWLPREGSKFDKKLGFVEQFTNPLSASEKGDVKDAWQSTSKAAYRKSVAELTSFLELPEVLLSAQRYEEINFHKLASKATFKLTKALLNETANGEIRSEDPKRIRLAEMFLEHLTRKGLKGGQLMPHEIVQEIYNKHKISPAREKVLDAQWKDLWKRVVEEVKTKAAEEGLEFNPTRMVPLSDVSGSMTGIPMMVSIALGIGISEITHPAFQNMVMTFESQPRWHLLKPNDSIVRKVRSLAAAPWGGSTNFEAAYDLVLQVCVQHNLPREDAPSLIVFSDMQFNQAAGSYHRRGDLVQTMHKTICAKVAAVAKTLKWRDSDPMPMVYWNLRNTRGHPVEKDTAGTVLLAGFSPSLLKLVMNGEAMKEEEVEVVQVDGTTRTEKIRVTPEEVLRKMLDDTLYDPVRVVLGDSSEGALADYDCLVELGATPAAKDAGDTKDFEMV